VTQDYLIVGGKRIIIRKKQTGAKNNGCRA
jgi:hypothetical protein